MTHNWGVPNQGQPWPGQQGWNRPPNGWTGPVPPPGPPLPAVTAPQGQYPPAPPAPQQPNYQAPPPAPGTPPGASGQQFTYGPPGGYYAAPPAKKNPLPAVLGGGAFVLIAMFFGMALINYLGAGGSGDPATDPTYHQVENVPAPDPNPPEIPQPGSPEQATDWLQKNAIYDKSVPVPTNCTVAYIDPTTASTAELEDHLNQLTACLWGVWEGPVTEAGFKLPRPPVTVYSTKITTPCGQSDTGNAFYCSGDQRIYYATDLPQKLVPAEIRTKPFVTDAVIAHEFGHALQGRTGIFVASIGWAKRSDEAEGRVFFRRLEVQADCMAGMWVNAVSKASKATDADYDNLKFLFYNIGDDVLTGEPDHDGNHGLGKNRQAWATIGLGNSQIGKCNTFVVPASEAR